MRNYNEIKNNSEKNGVLLDFCGSDERYYYSGLYTDLCGLSVEDFIKSTLLNCNGGGNNDTPGEIVKTLNTIIFSINSNGNLVVYANKAPKTDIKVTFTCESMTSTITLPANSTSVVNTNYTPINSELTVTNVSIEPNEDDLYKYGDYKVEKNEPMKSFTIYYNMVNSLNSSNLTNNDIKKFKNIVATINEQEITYMVPAAPEGVEELPEKEYLEWESKNFYQRTLVVPVEIYESNDNRKFNYLLGGVDAFIGFENVKTVTIDNENYCILVNTDDHVTHSRTEEITAGTYKFSLKE